MNPDYVGYVEQRTIRVGLRWQDVKFMFRKITGIQLDDFYIQRIKWGYDTGWLIELSGPYEVEDVMKHFYGSIKCGKMVFFVQER